MKPILQVKNLDVVLEKEKIINNLSFQVQSGEFLTILGPNGSGKTVLLKTLLNLLPYQGKITWSKKAHLGYLPQGLTQLKFKNFPLSVQEFLELKSTNIKRIKEYFSLLGLNSEILKKQVGHLSGGQFQRILMAWVLISQPNVLLFDEPTSGVDLGAEKTVYELLYKIWKKYNLTIILITHDLNIVYKYSTNVLCMNRDKVCQGKPKESFFHEKIKNVYNQQIKFYKHHH